MKSEANYSLPFACFSCRKSFKIAWTGFSPDKNDERTQGRLCPQCGQELRFCGRYFKAPAHRDAKGWREVEEAVRSGHQFN